MKGLLKRIWSVGLLLALCILVLPSTMLAAEQKNDVYVNSADTVGMAKVANETATIIDSGTCGDNLTWTLDSAGTLIISGTGEMYDYLYGVDQSSSPWYDKRDVVKKISISYGVTGVGNCSFAGCSECTSVIIPNSVNNIGICAFMYCDGLTSISIPDSVTYIDICAFSCCNGLTNIAIPSSVVSIGSGAFENCTSLNQVYIPSSVTQIGSGVFEGCYNLIDILVDNNNNIYYSENGILFSKKESVLVEYPAGKKEKNYEISNNIISINDTAFYECENLTSITIPNSVNNIGKWAFYGCKGLRNMVIPNKVISIEDGTFGRCENLTSITIPDSVTNIGKDAFLYCKGLTDVYYSGSKSQWDNIMINETGNDSLKNATIHYNSTGSDNISSVSRVNYLEQYNADNKQIFFGNSNLAYNITDTTEIVGADSIEQLVGKYALVETNPDDMLRVVKISTVESKIGICSEVGTNCLTIDGVSYTTPENWILDLYAGKQLLYHINDGKIVGAQVIEEKEGILEEWSNENKTVKISGVNYPVNYLTDLSFLANIDQTYGKEVSYYVGSGSDYNPIFKVFVHSYETKLGLFSHYDPISNAAFIDGISYAVNSDKCNIDNNALNGKKVFFLLDSGQIVHIDAIDKLQPTLMVSFAPNKGTLNFENGTFGSQNIPVQITVRNRIDYDFPQGYDKSIIYADSSLSNIILKSVIWENIDVLKVSNINAANVVLKPQESKVVTVIIEPKKNYTPANKEDSITSTLIITASVDANEPDISVEKNFITTVKNLDLGGSTPVGPDDGKRELTFWEKAFLENIYNVDNVNVKVDNGAFALSNYFDKSAIDDIGRTVTFWAAVRESQFAHNTKGDLPTCLQIDCKMTNSRYKRHNATLIFYCKSFLGWNYASFSNIKFVLIDRTSKAVLVEDGLYSVSVDASAKKFADGIQDYLKVQYGEDMKDFCKELGKNAIEEIISDTATITGKEYLNTMLDIFKNIQAISENADKFTKDYAGKLSAVLNNDLSFFVKDAKEIDEVLAKHIKAKCPVDVYVYNPQGELCAVIENDTVTLDTMEIFVDVTDSKKELWLNNGDYRLELVANGNGTMDYTVEEYSGMQKTRTVFFDDVPLSIGLSYNGNVPEQLNVPKIDYSLKANNGSTVYATSDTNDINRPSSGGNSGSGSSSSSGGGSSKSNISNISVPNISNGGISITPKNPVTGDTVTINLVPDNGYELEHIKVIDGAGNEVKITKAKENKYTFVMPEGKVKLDAAFIKIPTIKVEETKVMPFTDVKAGDWFYNAVKFAYENSLMNGETDILFMPNNNLNRAMLVTILYRLENSPSVSGANNFSDVIAGQWYSNAVVWASENGIVNGYEDGTFLPMQNVSREEMAAMLMRYAKYKGYDTSKTASLDSFSDNVKVNNWSADAMIWCVAEVLINGDNGALHPQGNAIRAEIATLLMRFCENVAK